ncbi:MAG: hypothetical protein JWR43_2856 [Phenylobacterium sp.]|nr:hypothetical protein [Phenylobacterium sp.]
MTLHPHIIVVSLFLWGPELQSLSPDWDNLYEYQADYAGSVFRADVTVRDSY